MNQFPLPLYTVAEMTGLSRPTVIELTRQKKLVEGQDFVRIGLQAQFFFVSGILDVISKIQRERAEREREQLRMHVQFSERLNKRPKKWTRETAIVEARKYKTRTEFRQACPTAYRLCSGSSFEQEAFGHMTSTWKKLNYAKA